MSNIELWHSLIIYKSASKGAKKMAEKTKDEEKIQVTIKLKKSMHDEVEKFAEKLGISKTQLIINLIDTGLDDVKIFNALKLYDLMMIGGRITRSIKEKFYKGEAVIEDGELKIKVEKK